jgi:diadenosine tetraphosphate (Ap4A) HIT family hydrolase
LLSFISMADCVFCSKIPKLLDEKSSFVVHEFKNSVLIVGEHQTFPGYCVLVLKSHVVELFDLDFPTQIEFQRELVASAHAINLAFSAEKMNVSSYGNMTPHLHWHIFPRKKSDANWPQPPWTLMENFKKNETSKIQAQKVTEMVQTFLAKK